jgi:Haem-binding domain
VKRLRKVLKWVVIVVAVLFVAAQFYRPAKTNPPVDRSMTFEARIQPSPQVAAILDRSCRDCHSNETRWPWYSNVAPMSWFVIDHVNHGRSHLNMSEWGRYDNNEASNQLRNMCREARSEVMPLASYTMVHRGAVMSQEDIKVLCDWVTAERQKLAGSSDSQK